MDIDNIKYNDRGLVPVIAQDVETGEVLMFAWMNRESLTETLRTGIMTYWSRSRREFWVKGKSSGNIQEVREVYVDCDGDCLLFRVVQKGRKAACHEGYRSCFFRQVDPATGNYTVIGGRVFDPAEVYGDEER